MKIINKIDVKIKNRKYTIDFGLPENDKEKQEMFRLRRRIYVEKEKYIPAALCKDELEIDSYDNNGFCTYFIAMVDGNFIGTVRLIRMTPLPIAKNYFEFDEPEEVKMIPSSKKAEVGRFISVGLIGNNFLPRHLVLLGLFDSLERFAYQNGIEVGYGAIKKLFLEKLETIKFPFKRITEYRVIYTEENEDPLKNFFKDENNPVIPIYFLRNNVRNYLDSLLKETVAFKQINDSHFVFRGEIGMGMAIIAKKLGLN